MTTATTQLPAVPVSVEKVSCKTCKKTDVEFNTYRGKPTLSCSECLLKKTEMRRLRKQLKETHIDDEEPVEPIVDDVEPEPEPIVKPKKERKSKKHSVKE